MARKIVPASRTVGDRTFKLNENTRYSTTADNKGQRRSAPAAGHKGPRMPNGKMAPNVNNTSRSTGTSRTAPGMPKSNYVEKPIMVGRPDMNPRRERVSRGGAGSRPAMPRSGGMPSQRVTKTRISRQNLQNRKDR